MDSLFFNEDYLRRLSQGDPAVEQHFADHFGALLRIKLRSRVRSPELVEDVRQETFLRVLKNIRKGAGAIERPEHLGAYVNGVCNIVLLEFFRSEGRFQPMEEDGAARMPDPAAAPDEQIVTAERKQLVARILAELPGKDRDLLRAVFFDARDKDEVCRQYGIEREYLRVLLYRARLRFKERYQKANSAKNSL